MSSNGWYAPPHGDYQQQAYPSSDASAGRAAADSVQDAHRLLAVYPFASATPTSNVTRHLSNLTVSTTTPSYVQPHYYSVHGFNYPTGNPPPYTEYATELNHLQSHQQPTNDSGYWANTRNDAVRYLGDQGNGSVLHYVDYQQYTPSHSYPSYPTSAFAQSVFQQTMPSLSYPTPPPPGIQSSSSSLAFALEDPTLRSQRKAYSPKESASFFNNFLDRSSRELERAQAAKFSTPSTPRKDRMTPAFSSPDPLALGPTKVVTPQKRKPVDQLQSPSFKRVQSLHRTASSSSLSSAVSGPPSTPSSSQGSMSTQVTPAPPPKRRLQAYVQLPPAPKAWSTPSSHSVKKATFKTPVSSLKGKHKMEVDDDEDDLGGFGVEEDDYQPRKTSLAMSDLAKSSAKRTGDRDDRGPLEKLTTLLEDIFEAEDGVPADADLDSLPLEFFSPLTADPTRPQLHPNVIRKLTKYLTQVARPVKRLRAQSAAANTPRTKVQSTIADLDTMTLSRILKILERTVRLGEDLDPFRSEKATEPRGSTASPSKKKSAKGAKKAASQAERRSMSQTPHGEDDVAGGDDRSGAEEDPSQVTEADLDKLARILDVARDSILAADCCIALLGSDRLPKQVYSEELITTCLGAIKNQLNKVIYPFVEAPSDAAQSSPLLRYISKMSSHDVKDRRRQLAETFQALSSVLPRINNLVCAGTLVMSDSIIIQAVYIAIGPFFVVESDGSEGKGKKENVVLSTLGQSAMRGLRLEALSLIRSIFGNHEDQRSWIIEEILSSLIKLSDTKQKAGQFRLRDGRSIRTVSALLLQLVQTSAHGVRVHARQLGKERQQNLTLRRQESMADANAQKAPEPLLDEKDNEEIHLYLSGLESATKAAKTIVIFLTQRSGKGKATKNSNEAEYRTIFDNLVSDLLVVLFWPEWPAASLLLGIVCKFMVSSLDDVKNSSQTDNNAAKTIALDHLGVIAARLRSSTLKCSETGGESNLKPLDEIMSNLSVKALERLVAAHQDIASHLAKRSSEDQAYDSARELTAVTWGQELAMALRQCNAAVSDGGDGDDLDLIQGGGQKMLPFARKVKTALRDVWKDAATDVFDVGSQDEVARVDRLAEEIGIVQDLKNSYHPILNVILLALDAPPVFMRTKALRALGQIVTSDPTILSAANVRRGIESHLLDSSPAVRDAAVELIGKYMIDSPEVAGDYYQKIADRIADTGLGVRKRVIKLLKSFYSVTDDNKRRIDICTRLVLRMFDEDDTVKDLAVKTIEEIWFQAPLSSVNSQKSRPAVAESSVDKTQLLAKVSIIMGVAANFKDRQSPLEDLLHKIMAYKEGSEASDLHARYGDVCEALIDGLVDASELPGFTVVNCIRTIYLFTSAYPPVLSGSNASTLLPYLKNATSPEEQITSDYLLKIFRVSTPHMPKTAAKFGHELQMALQPMILKPSTSGGVQALQETVACLCAVVRHLTHDFTRLVGLLKSCNARLQTVIKKGQMIPSDVRTLSILIFIISLLVEHCDFDRLRNEHPDLNPDLDIVSKGSIIEHVYTSLLNLYRKHDDPGLRGRTLQCLGFLFRAQPTLMTLESSAVIMDAIFASQEEDGRGRLLKIMQDFLVSEAAKHSLKEKNKTGSKGKQVAVDVNMDELVGNTDGFADSGVSSAIVQRYMDPILQAALSQHMQTQAAAVDILSFTIKQGLAHPLQSFPVIVALETSPNVALSARASALHAILHTKHASLLNSRYTVSARASFDYQKTLAIGPVQGYRTQTVTTALLHRWYALVREKRGPKLDFLKSLVRVFDLGTALNSSGDDVDFARYMAENFAAFEYKTQEEVLLVIKSLTNVLSTAGMQCVEALSPAHLLAQLRGDGDVQMADAQAMVGQQATEALPATPAPPPWQTLEKLPLLRSSVIVALIMLLKAYLKTLYGLSEDKCLKWVIGKKNAVGDRPATRRHATPLAWTRLPFAARPILTTSDMAEQRDTFLQIWNEDGVAAEPEDDFAV
ncbi:hypothetical protein BV25DRAFT_1934347 [Artomyces pyxidatus]|uniref:Uncharacterized protein n=1 Tax=Artomyces pyxidatus TaxID=48021 RepID=A0ACB8T7E0_9AGAM|nr:hypothetical protein BV25DRAFT_1934347 [Artomyces pyxidatus]